MWIAVRTPPQIVRRNVAGWPAHATGILVSPLPAALVDPVARLQRRLTIAGSDPYGIPVPDDGLLSRVRRVGEVPLQDVGFVRAVRSGTVTPVAAVTGFEGTRSCWRRIGHRRPGGDRGNRLPRGLEKMVGHLGVLDEGGMPKVHGGPPAAPGLFFLGYSVSLRACCAISPPTHGGSRPRWHAIAAPRPYFRHARLAFLSLAPAGWPRLAPRRLWRRRPSRLARGPAVSLTLVQRKRKGRPGGRPYAFDTERCKPAFFALPDA